MQRRAANLIPITLVIISFPNVSLIQKRTNRIDLINTIPSQANPFH